MKYAVVIIGALGAISSAGVRIRTMWGSTHPDKLSDRSQLSTVGLVVSLVLMAIGLSIIFHDSATGTDAKAPVGATSAPGTGSNGPVGTTSGSSPSPSPSMTSGGPTSSGGDSTSAPSTSNPGTATSQAPAPTSPTTHVTRPSSSQSAATTSPSNAPVTQPTGNSCWDHQTPKSLGDQIVLTSFGNINMDSPGRLTTSSETTACGGTIEFDPTLKPAQLDFSQSVNMPTQPTSIAACKAGGAAWDDYKLTVQDNNTFLCGPEKPGATEYLVVKIVDASHMNDGAASATVTLTPVAFIH